MFDNLSLKLERAFKTLKGQGSITEINIATTVKEIRRALIDADVNFKVAKDVTDSIREKALDRDVMIAVSPGQLLTKIVNEELAELMGGSNEEINVKVPVSSVVTKLAGSMNHSGTPSTPK